MPPELLPAMETHDERIVQGLLKSITNVEKMGSCKKNDNRQTLLSFAISLKSFLAVSNLNLALLTSIVISSTVAPCL